MDAKLSIVIKHHLNQARFYSANPYFKVSELSASELAIQHIDFVQYLFDNRADLYRISDEEANEIWNKVNGEKNTNIVK
jgi:hypothetical protein